MSASRDRVLAVALPVVNDAGYDLDDLSVMAAGRRRLVRVMIDSDHGVDLDEAAAVSRAVSEALDESGAMGETPYVLEVTSRGVSRPLTLPRHWRRARTRLVKVTLAEDTLTGRILDADDEQVTLDVDGNEVVVPFAGVTEAVVQVEFNRPRGLAADELADEADDISGDDLADDDLADDEAEADDDERTGRG